MILKRPQFLSIVIIGIILFLSKDSFLFGQQRDEMPTKFNKVDSINLKKYYPKPTITAIEILAGFSSSTIRGIQSSSSSTGTNGGYSVEIKTLDDKIGYAFGIGLSHSVSKTFELYARIIGERKGIESKIDSLSFSFSDELLGTTTLSENNTKNDYISFSLTPQFLIGKRTPINIGAGVYYSILVQSKITNLYYFPTPHSVYSKGFFHSNDFGLSLNVGYSFTIKRNILFTIQYLNNYGLRQVSKWHTKYDFPPWHNSSQSLIIGVRFIKQPFNK